MTKIKLLIILISSLIFLTLGRSAAQAADGLTVNWGVTSGQPIFVVENFLPGQEESRTVIITNNSTASQPVNVRGVKTAETDDLAGILEIIISQNGNDLYGGSKGIKTLSQFFVESTVPEGLALLNLNPGASASLVFKVSFPSSAGNQYQKKSLVFDLKILSSTPAPVCQPSRLQLLLRQMLCNFQKNFFQQFTRSYCQSQKCSG